MPWQGTVAKLDGKSMVLVRYYEFVDEDASWAHLDIASAANNDGAPYSVYPSGATGVMVRTLVNLAGLIYQSQ